MAKLLTHILTEDDNNTFCIARVGLFLALAAFIGIAVFEFITTRTFHYSEFANGIMQMLGGGGVAIGAKQYTSTPQARYTPTHKQTTTVKPGMEDPVL